RPGRGRVVAAEQGVRRADDRGVGQRDQRADPISEGPAVERPEEPRVVDLSGDRAVIEGAAAGEAEDRQAEWVVHQRVEPVAEEPLRGFPPDLADEGGIWPDGPDALAEPRPGRRGADVGR